MSDIAIKVENLGKQYRIGSQKASYRTLRDSVMDAVQAPFRRAAGLIRGESYGAADLDKTIWALRNVNLEIQQGEVVGVIGRNGAGKSTLLKILSRITEPTEGQALIRGRVGSLLEVGTGFHPELTGRENIFLNGSILGMRREEINSKFDEIVEFSGIDDFIDTPVKLYSSGMRVRLAFSVAAHLEPEILLVDEVLAVGDVEFQKKCLGKMGEISKTGRTVLFVSHNLPMVQTLCPESILIDEGKIVTRGSSSEVIERYLENKSNQTGEYNWEWDSGYPETLGDLIPVRLSIIDQNEHVTNRVMSKQHFQVEFQYRLLRKISNLRVGIVLKTFNGTTVFLSWDRDRLNGEDLYDREMGEYLARCKIPANLLNEHRYILGIISGIKGAKRLFRDYDVLSFSVDTTDGVGSHWGDSRKGVIRPDLQWSTQTIRSSKS